MSNDYDLPAEWAAMTPTERDRWFKQERARRQALGQDTATAHRIEKGQERLDRRVDARSETVDVAEHR